MARVRTPQRLQRASLARAGGLIAVCTLLLTADFVGLVALLTGQATGIAGRLPVYVLGMAVAFVGSLLLFETREPDGETVLKLAAGVAFGSFVVAVLGGEGVVFALTYPGQVVASHVLPYLLAAGMIATGLGYWGLNHWQELGAFRTGTTSSSDSMRLSRSGRR
jgi:hypothetical protein